MEFLDLIGNYILEFGKVVKDFQNEFWIPIAKAHKVKIILFWIMFMFVVGFLPMKNDRGGKTTMFEETGPLLLFLTPALATIVCYLPVFSYWSLIGAAFIGLIILLVKGIPNAIPATYEAVKKVMTS